MKPQLNSEVLISFKILGKNAKEIWIVHTDELKTEQHGVKRNE